MIKLDISMALFIYLLMTAILLLVLWSFFSFGTKLKTFSSDEKYIWHCSICALTYVDSRHDEISACPRCASYNHKKSAEDVWKETQDSINTEEEGVKE